MMALHESVHASTGMCLWTLLSFAVLGIMIVVAGVHMYRQKKRDDDFRKEMDEKYSAGTMAMGEK